MSEHLHETLPFLLNRIAAIVSEEVNSTFKPAGLTVYSARVLILLHLEGACSVGELAEKAALDQSTLSHILRRLHESGLVDKERPDHDSRTVMATLTKAGEAAGEECWLAAQSHDELLRKGLSETDFETLKGLLKKIYENAPAFRFLNRSPAVKLRSHAIPAVAARKRVGEAASKPAAKRVSSRGK